MIYTITFSPSIDYVMKVNTLERNKINRVHETQMKIGGKGINVSSVLKNFGMETEALGFIGGFTGDYIFEQLRAKNITARFIQTNVTSRINVKLRGGGETDINVVSKPLDECYVEKLAAMCKSMRACDTVVIAGNVCASNEGYCALLETLKAKKVRVIVDTTGEKLRLSLPYKPFLIKPNRSELEELCGCRITTDGAIRKCATELLTLGAENVLVSLGESGAYLFGHDYEKKMPAPGGEVRDTVGAGDSMIAGFLYGYFQVGKTMDSALKWSIAAGSATTFTGHLADFQTIEKLAAIM